MYTNNKQTAKTQNKNINSLEAEKKETPQTKKTITVKETPEEKKANKETRKAANKEKFYKDRSERANEIKEDLKQTLILQSNENKTFKNTKYTQERKEAVFNAIIDEIENGESVTNAVNKYRVYSRTFFDWVDKDVNFYNRYARAHTKRADALFNRMIDVAVNMPDVNRARLVNDTIKYVCARISPEKYSEKQNINIISNTQNNILNLSSDEREAKILELMNKANLIDQ